MTYTAPIDDMFFVLEDLCDLVGISQLPGLEDATPETVKAILDEAGKYASQVLSPLNRVGDLNGLGFDDGTVSVPDGWQQAYESLVEMGWNSPSASPDQGGMGLPNLVNACIQEMFQGANMAFQLCPMLTQGAIEALDQFGSDALKETYLPKLVSGEWTGTMNLTEPQAGSDLAAIRSKAVPEGDHYRISGQKIFITYGEHEMAENIIHLVLARLPDAPEGVKGISLFVVPKFIPEGDGSIGMRNDLKCVSIEHKLGIHASPTCTMSFGDSEGAIGYLVGEPNRGLESIFTMMNNARLNVGLQGIGVSEHACQDAFRYACDRTQGRAAGHNGLAPIIAHADVRRMLASMQATTRAMRILAYRAACSLDYQHYAPTPEAREHHRRRVDLLIPVVKGYSTEAANQITSTGVQVHGGMGYIEETGAAQHLRDARITAIYEGTTGIQALDLVGRKIIRDEGKSIGDLISDIRESARQLSMLEGSETDWRLLSASVGTAADFLSTTTDWLIDASDRDPGSVPAAANNVLELLGISLGMWCLADAARAACLRLQQGEDSPSLRAWLQYATFYALQVFPLAGSLQETIETGSDVIAGMTPDVLGAQIA